MAIKPILFNTEMVRAILDGRKTVTRRVVKPRYRDDEYGFEVNTNCSTGERWIEKYDENESAFDKPRYVKPPYLPGDIMYVRETWAPYCINKKTCKNIFIGHSDYCYKATKDNDCVDKLGCKWHPSIHMPKEAARIWLRVTDVRVERLQNMWASDTSKEGIIFNRPYTAEEMLQKFAELWDSTIKKSDLDRYGWEANPWVYVIEFERIKKDETM